MKIPKLDTAIFKYEYLLPNTSQNAKYKIQRGTFWFIGTLIINVTGSFCSDKRAMAR